MKYDALVAQEKVFDTTESIKDTVKMLNMSACISNVEVQLKEELSGGRSLLREVLTDAERVTQVFQNVGRLAIYFAK